MVRKRTPGRVEKLEEAFRELSQQPPDKTPTKLEVVKTYREWIGQLVERGHSYVSIAEAMTKKGVKISPHTLRQYFGKVQRSDREAMRAHLPKVEAAQTAGSPALMVATAKDVEIDGQVRKNVEHPGRYRPILPGETEL
jgi:cysteinyl-tRNA synthetase